MEEEAIGCLFLLGERRERKGRGLYQLDARTGVSSGKINSTPSPPTDVLTASLVASVAAASAREGEREGGGEAAIEADPSGTNDEERSFFSG